MDRSIGGLLLLVKGYDAQGYIVADPCNGVRRLHAMMVAGDENLNRHIAERCART